MATVIQCQMNAGMERCFPFLKDGLPCNLSRDPRFSVFLDVLNLNASNEQRYLRVIERHSNTQKYNILLNDNAGKKPLKGQTDMYEPHRRPNPRPVVLVDVDVERVFFAEINLSANNDYEVYLRIDPSTDIDDQRRYLSFKRKAVAALDDDDPNDDVDLNPDGGKKPLGGD